MGTVVFVCGCSITSSMFGLSETMRVCVCDKHNQDNIVQAALNQAVARMYQQQSVGESL